MSHRYICMQSAVLFSSIEMALQLIFSIVTEYLSVTTGICITDKASCQPICIPNSVSTPTASVTFELNIITADFSLIRIDPDLTILITTMLIWRHCISVSYSYVCFVEIKCQASSFITLYIFLQKQPTASLVNTPCSLWWFSFTNGQLCYVSLLLT